ncbi:MAG: toll/interleukin-1 receptor domain-containing protein, partial [Planctomycetaceae bacterium]
MATDATTAYVPGYDYDVFISYARDNDKTDPGDNSSGWVATLKDRLERLVNERLAADGKIKVFFDSGSIAPNAPLSDTLRHAATRTATLVVIFSPRYLKRPWCTQERELFVKSAAQAAEGSASGLSRIFLVHFDEVPLERRPAEFQNLLGIDFYFKHPVEGWTRELYDDDTVPTELKVTYNERLRKLRHHLAETLNSMRREAEARLSRKAVEEVVDSKKPTIFLAEPCDKISRKLRAQVESAALAEFRILPEKFYDRGADRYRAALERDLAESVLFVQILGDEGSTWTDDLPEGYEGLQWAVASEKQTPALRFRPDNLDLEEIAQENPRYQQFLTGPGIQAGDIEMFRNKVIELARQLTQPPIELESGSEATGPRVLLSFDDSDASLAEEL